MELQKLREEIRVLKGQLAANQRGESGAAPPCQAGGCSSHRSSSCHPRDCHHGDEGDNRSSSCHPRDSHHGDEADDWSSSCHQEVSRHGDEANDRSSSCHPRDCHHGDAADGRSSSCHQGDRHQGHEADDRSSSGHQRDSQSILPGERASSDHQKGIPPLHMENYSSFHQPDTFPSQLHHDDRSSCPGPSKSSLSNAEILRYSRQLVLPELGVRGQLHLSQASVLVIGCGGLGCPLAQYLAAAGVGRLGLVDYDTVEMSNLHRQVLHTEERVGTPKATSVAAALQQLNSSVECVPYQVMLRPDNALHLVRQYDIIADCSDNVPTRYLVNDACVASGKPLVSASALRWEGQLTTYNHQDGPCYRCLFPTPPPPETITNCADGGVLGLVPGIMGSLQALEVLKIACKMAPAFSGVLLMYDALDGRFRHIKLRGKRPDCAACGGGGDQPLLEDYEAFCGSSASDKCRSLHLLRSEERLTVHQYQKLLEDRIPHLLIDVRPIVEVDICRLEHSIHIPLHHLEEHNPTSLELLQRKWVELQEGSGQSERKLITICKLGNDSQKAVRILQRVMEDVQVMDVAGGLMAWAAKIDPTFPRY
ncbi:adenylyltransferase and sulfurtransferase MOCS3-like [Hyperolius riggenbachi]|uniref:adenylyltransferase and sulfurtransferase MOCS3-like n=1 Tax=Hyperolius riggenbachi TaxID=752182 RepID=UPI0035A267FB